MHIQLLKTLSSPSLLLLYLICPHSTEHCLNSLLSILCLYLATFGENRTSNKVDKRPVALICPHVCTQIILFLVCFAELKLGSGYIFRWKLWYKKISVFTIFISRSHTTQKFDVRFKTWHYENLKLNELL